MEIRKVSNERFQLVLMLLVLAAVFHIASTCSEGCKCDYNDEKGHFMECYNISSLIFENVPSNIQTLSVDGGKVDTLNNKTFEVFQKLENLKISNVFLTMIEPYTFMGMTSLTSVQFNHVEIKKLVNNTFYDLPNLKSISYTDGVLQDLDADWIQKSNNVKYLNFSNNTVTLLKQYYFLQLPNLLSIIFDNNEISEINGSTFIKNTELIQLHLNTNKLKELKSHYFKDLKRLRILSLQRNEISDIDSRDSGLEELRELYLNHNKVHTYRSIRLYTSSYFFDMLQLEKLNLSNNLINSFFYSPLPNQARLRTLDLSNNKLKVMTDQYFRGLYSLESLFVDNNEIHYIALTVFSHTPALLTLSLRNNKFTDIYSSVQLRGLSKLRELYLNENQITHAARWSFDEMPSLQRLELTGNKLFGIKTSYFPDLKNLVHLDISQNIISKLEDYSFEHLHKLNRLVISKNQLTKLTNSSFFGLKALSVLEIDDNKISDIQNETFKPLINVEYFSIQRNQLDLHKTITDGIFKPLKNMKKIMLGGHKLEILDSEILQPLQNIEEVNLDNCAITNIDLKLLDNETTLIKNLQLFQNSITEVNSDCFVKLTSLETLNLNNNQINKIEKNAFRFSNKILRLSLVGNKMTEITEHHLHGLHSLKILDISSNIIGDISESALDDLVSLEELYMNKNNLKEIPANILQHMKSLKTLNISMNPLQFSCSLFSSLRDILTSRIGHDLSKPTFGYPNWLKGLSVSEVEQLLSLGPSACENRVCYYEYNISCAIAHEKYGKTCPSSDFSCGCEIENGNSNCFPKTDCRIQNCDNEGICNNLIGRWKCICKPGWSGNFCETDLNESNVIDSCQVNNCKNGATCVPYEETYNCSCTTDYEGIYCENKKCPQTGCINECPDGFYGQNCDKPIYKCNNNECQNNGNCIPNNSSYICSCKTGYIGANCETVESYLCNINPCRNGGTCLRYNNTYFCRCPSNFDGDNCKEIQENKEGFFKSTTNIVLVCLIFTFVLFVVGLMALCWKQKRKRQGKRNQNRPVFNNPTIEMETNYYTVAVDGPVYENVYEKNDYKC